MNSDCPRSCCEGFNTDVAFRNTDRDCHFMDKKEPCKEDSEDATRESLIAISYRLPETELISEQSPKKLDTEKVVQPQKRDGDEKYRSKLISISNSQSPDAKILPVLPGQVDD